MPSPNASYVAVQPNSSGQPIETVLVQQAPTYGTTPGIFVGRQVMVIGDPNVDGSVASVTAAGEVVVFDPQLRDSLALILVQLRILNQLISTSPSLGLMNQNPPLDQLEERLLSIQRAPRI